MGGSGGAPRPTRPPFHPLQHEVTRATVSGTEFVVSSRYKLGKVIGTGAYGVVVAAEDTLTGTRVAIKKVPHWLNDLVDAKRVLREVKLLRALGEWPRRRHDAFCCGRALLTHPAPPLPSLSQAAGAPLPLSRPPLAGNRPAPQRRWWASATPLPSTRAAPHWAGPPRRARREGASEDTR